MTLELVSKAGFHPSDISISFSKIYRQRDRNASDFPSHSCSDIRSSQYRIEAQADVTEQRAPAVAQPPAPRSRSRRT